jgi:hypothetical protein
MPDPQPNHSESSLVQALAQLSRAVTALGEVDTLLSGCGVPESDRAAIASCVLSLYRQESWIRGQLQRSRRELTIPAPSAGAPPAPSVAAMRLFRPGSGTMVELQADDGRTVPMRLERADGDRVVATAIGASQRPGSVLRGRLPGDGGVGWQVELECEAITELTGDRALLSLRVAGVDPDDGGQRRMAGGEAHLEVVECEQIAEESEVMGQVLELSTAGFAFSTTAPLRAGDRLRFHRRWMAEEVDGDVRVASVRDADRPGSLVVSCWFVDIDPQSQAAIGRVLARRSTNRNPVDYRGLLALAESEQPPRRRWLPRFRRSR